MECNLFIFANNFPKCARTCLDSIKILKASLTHHMPEEQHVSGQHLGIIENIVNKELRNRGNKSCCRRKMRMVLKMMAYVEARL